MPKFCIDRKIIVGGGKTDILKIVLAVMIVIIHTVNFGIFSPVLRCAVPLFFMISATFFWNKVGGCTYLQQKEFLRKFIVRNLKLYLFWFIALAPITFITKNYFDDGIVIGAVRFIRSFLFDSTFSGSWFIMALVMGVTIIFYLSKRLNNALLLVISVAFYIFCVLTSNYNNLLQNSDILNTLTSSYILIFSSPFNSFPASLVWIVLAKIIVEKEINMGNVAAGLIAIVSSVMLALEYVIIQRFDLALCDDSYFMLLPLCFCLYLLFCRLDVGLPEMKYLRKMSTIIYCSHISVSIVVSYVIRHFVGIDCGSTFFPTLIICICLSAIIIKTEKYSHFSWLRYAY